MDKRFEATSQAKDYLNNLPTTTEEIVMLELVKEKYQKIHDEFITKGLIECAALVGIDIMNIEIKIERLEELSSELKKYRVFFKTTVIDIETNANENIIPDLFRMWFFKSRKSGFHKIFKDNGYELNSIDKITGDFKSIRLTDIIA